eukprot:1147635-Pelagomonas_calceolata.AAC.13
MARTLAQMAGLAMLPVGAAGYDVEAARCRLWCLSCNMQVVLKLQRGVEAAMCSNVQVVVWKQQCAGGAVDAAMCRSPSMVGVEPSKMTQLQKFRRIVTFYYLSAVDRGV